MSAATELELESELSSLESEGELELAGELEQDLELAQNSPTNSSWSTSRRPSTRRSSTASRPWPIAGGARRRCAVSRWPRRVRRSGARLGPGLSSKAKANSVRLEGELGEFEGAHELEFEASAAQLANFAAAMEHEGHAASEAANEQEAAEHFLPLIGLAAKFVLPKLAGLAAEEARGSGAQEDWRQGPRPGRRPAPAPHRPAPDPSRDAAAHARRRQRHAHACSATVRRVRSSRRCPASRAPPWPGSPSQVARGRRITPQMAIRTLAQQTARTLSNPRTLAHTYRRARALDRRYHRRTRRVLGRPAGAPVRAQPTSDPGGNTCGGGASLDDGRMAHASGMAYPGAALPRFAPGCAGAVQPRSAAWSPDADGLFYADGRSAGPTCASCGR